MLFRLLQGPIGALGFFFKEIMGVLRQPRLFVSLVLGPFLILLLFGLGFRGQQPEFTTRLVLPPDSELSQETGLLNEAFSGVFKLEQVTHDEAEARAALRARQVDVVVIVPAGVADRLYEGQQVELPVLFSETDPTEGAWVRYFAYVQVSELNRRILTEVVKQSKGPAAQALEYTQLADSEALAIDADLQQGNIPSAAARAARLLAATQAARAGVGRALDTLTGSVGGGRPGDEAQTLLGNVEAELIGLQADLAQGPSGIPTARQRVQNIRTNTSRLSSLSDRLNRIPPETLVSPFTAGARNEVPVEPTPIAFYTPAVLALLLQHMAVTLSAMSAVRDRLLGSMELFRVSPIGASQILIGKSLGYGLLLALVGLALSSAATLFLGVPSLGDPFYYWLSIAITIFAALGLGFALAVFAGTESQAVQLSMLVLLASVFFGGFFLPLEQLARWLQAISFLLPVTYGAIDLREVMLRGTRPAAMFLVGPLVLGLVLYAIAYVGLRRQMRRA
jgi:ABC-2 type transport system permease protein